jgi:RNA polymerase sigma-70 factor (ECF subfamily)
MENAQDFDSHSEGVHISGNDGLSILGCEEIQRHLDAVEMKHTQPFLMHFDGYKYEEIAEQLNLPIGTVKNRIHIARKELQGKMARS